MRKLTLFAYRIKKGTVARNTSFHLRKGFTLVELVMVMIIVGILAVMALPRFFDRTAFDARGFSDQTLAALRYAQKSAIAQRRTVCVNFSAASDEPARVTLRITSTFAVVGPCDTDLRGPDGKAPYTITAPAGISFSSLAPGSTANSFNPLGQAGFGQTVQVSGASGAITIERETGYVHHVN